MIYTRDDLYAQLTVEGGGHYVAIQVDDMLLYNDDPGAPVCLVMRRVTNARLMSKPPRQQDLDYIRQWLETNMEELS